MKTENAVEHPSLAKTCGKILLLVCIFAVWTAVFVLVPYHYWDIVWPLLKKLFIIFMSPLFFIAAMSFIEETFNPRRNYYC